MECIFYAWYQNRSVLYHMGGILMRFRFAVVVIDVDTSIVSD